MAKQSAGLLVYRRQGRGLQVLLVHPGGPFFRNKDIGAWSVPKGELDAGEDPLQAAIRELEEETCYRITGTFIPLDPVKQKSGKTVQAWAVEGDMDTATFISNTFTIEWPPHSGKQQTFAEADKAGWFALDEARKKINPAQAAFLTQLEAILQNNH